MMHFGGGRSDEDGGNVFTLVIGIALMLLAPLVATILQLAISRKREFLADASGALLTRYPEDWRVHWKKLVPDPRPVATASDNGLNISLLLIRANLCGASPKLFHDASTGGRTYCPPTKRRSRVGVFVLFRHFVLYALSAVSTIQQAGISSGTAIHLMTVNP